MCRQAIILINFILHQNEAALNLVTRFMDALTLNGFNYNEDVNVWDQIPDLFQPGCTVLNNLDERF